MRSHIKSFLFLSVLTLGLSACSVFQRSNDSGYSGDEYDELAPRQTKSSRSLSPQESEQMDEQNVLKKLEKSIPTNEERTQYYKYKPFLYSVQDRIEFLSLSGKSARERWAQSRGITNRFNRFSREVSSLVEKNDIALGMPKQAVRESWGEPKDEFIAGNSTYGNERWHYTIYVPTQEGHQEHERIVYFEGGKVAGWETK